MLPLTKWSPFRELTEFHREVDNIFNKVFGRERLNLPLLTGTYGYPAIDCAKVGDNLVYRVEVPGMDPKDIEISVEGNHLTIRGERKETKDLKEEDYIMREIGYGSFERTMPLPEGAKADQIKARYNKGLLEIMLPAPEVEARKKVHIEVTEEPRKLKAA